MSLLGSAVASPAKLAPRDLSVIQYNLQRVEYTVKQLDRQKRLAQQAGAQAAVLDGLIYLSMQAGALVDSIISKQNFLGPGVGQPYKTRLLTAIDRAVTEYKKR